MPQDEPEVREAKTRREPFVGFFGEIAKAIATCQALPKVYPLYLTSLLKQALKQPDPEGIVATVGDIETIGDCRYAIRVTDDSGTSYRVTVEVLS